MEKIKTIKNIDGINTLLLQDDKKVIMIKATNNGITYQNGVDGELIEISRFYIAEIWRVNGGSFVRLLGNALYIADGENVYLLINTFLKYVGDYFDEIIKLEAKTNY